MRESFGGVFMIKLVLIFIVIYVSFMAVAVNYAKAFRVKNQVINILEQYQYNGETAVEETIDTYLANVPYNFSNNDSVKNSCYNYNKADYADTVFTGLGACIVPQGDADKRYYRVVTYISIDFPFFRWHWVIPISGETKTIRT